MRKIILIALLFSGCGLQQLPDTNQYLQIGKNEPPKFVYITECYLDTTRPCACTEATEVWNGSPQLVQRCNLQ